MKGGENKLQLKHENTQHSLLVFTSADEYPTRAADTISFCPSSIDLRLFSLNASFAKRKSLFPSDHSNNNILANIRLELLLLRER